MQLLRIILLLLLLTSVRAGAESIDSLFVQVPVKELPLLERNPRLDMLDLYNYKMVAKGENIFGGNSLMLHKTEHYICLQLTDVSRWELMRLKADSVMLYACLHTLTAPVDESRLVCYRTDWTPEPGVALPSFTLNDFWVESDSVSTEDKAELRRRLQPLRLTMQWQADDADTRPTLVVSVAVAHLDMENRAAAGHCLKRVSLRWEDGRFVR